MKRLLAVLAAVCVLAGCQYQRSSSGVDPFFGHTRVPAPGTGSAVGGPIDPYYGGTPYSAAPQGATTVAPPYVPPTTADPPSGTSGPGYSPPGGSYDFQGSSWTPVGTSGDSATRTESAAVALSERSLPTSPENSASWASRERVVQVLQPRDRAAGSSEEIRIPIIDRTPVADEPPRFRASNEAVEITDLPPAGRRSSSAWTGSASGGDSVRLASAATSGAANQTTAFSPTEPAAPAEYGHDPEYRWLRGKLEYSQINRHWTLRYIPAGGSTDSFGGSVVLPEERLPTGCERGDFLEVTGRLSSSSGVARGYAPSYEVAEVRRVN